MKLQVINDIHTILQENVNVTHRKCQDYKNALKAKKTMGGKVSEDEFKIFDELNKKYFTAKNALREFEEQDW